MIRVDSRVIWTLDPHVIWRVFWVRDGEAGIVCLSGSEARRVPTRELVEEDDDD